MVAPPRRKTSEPWFDDAEEELLGTLPAEEDPYEDDPDEEDIDDEDPDNT